MSSLLQDLEEVEYLPEQIAFKDNLTLEEWAAFGRSIYSRANGLTWQLADWAAFATHFRKHREGEEDDDYGTLKEFCAANGESYETAKNYASVARRVPRCNRLHTLGFCHHREVAGLPESQQKKWLIRAQAEGLSYLDLRAKIRQALGTDKALAKTTAQFRTIGTKFDEVKSFILAHEPDDPWWDLEKYTIWKTRLDPIIDMIGGLRQRFERHSENDE